MQRQPLLATQNRYIGSAYRESYTTIGRCRERSTLLFDVIR